MQIKLYFNDPAGGVKQHQRPVAELKKTYSSKRRS